MRNSTKNFLRAGLFTAIAAVLVFGFQGEALAQGAGSTTGLGGVVRSVTTNLQQIPTMLGTIFQAVGIWFAGKGAFALKEMAEDGRDQGLAKKALTYGVAGVLMVALPTMMGVGMDTLFQSKANNLTTNQTIQVR
jgi:H+/Cl- antiporter ClcA